MEKTADFNNNQLQNRRTIMSQQSEDSSARPGLVEEPCFLKLKEEDQEKGLLQLSQSETDDDRQLAKEL